MIGTLRGIAKALLRRLDPSKRCSTCGGVITARYYEESGQFIALYQCCGQHQRFNVTHLRRELEEEEG